jgi:hypothetical protein
LDWNEASLEELITAKLDKKFLALEPCTQEPSASLSAAEGKAVPVTYERVEM